MRTFQLNSISDLIATGPAWNDLWKRSDVALPTVRAELIAQWVEQFEPHMAFHALVVESDGRWIAALPLVGCYIAKMIPGGGLPANAWSCCGDLLLDPTADVETAMDLMLESACDLPWPLLWLSEAVSESTRWRAMFRACERVNILSEHHERYRVGRVEILHDWDAYLRQLRKSHRQNMNRVSRRLEDEGEVRLDRYSTFRPDEVVPLLNTAFQVEAQSWKGTAGTSVLGTPGMFEYYTRQAEQLAADGHLEIVMLRLNESPIATAYGFQAKGIFFVNKIGYDPQFGAFSPGQQLFFRLLEQLHDHSGIHALDFMGPMTESLSRWQPATYGVDRIALALHRPFGRAAVYAYKNWWPRIRQLKIALASEPDQAPVESPAGEPAGM